MQRLDSPISGALRQYRLWGDSYFTFSLSHAPAPPAILEAFLKAG